MAGNLAVPNDFAAATGNVAASKIDDNFTQVETYVNTREVAVGLLSARPAAGVAGRWYVASDVSGGTAYVDTGVAWVQTGAGVVGASAQMFRSYLAGLALANNGSDATNDLDVAVGECRSDDDAEDLALGTALTKRLDAAWVVGNNEGGLDTGAIANTTYHVFLIKRPDTGVVDALFSASLSPTMPTNYTKKRRLGSITRVSGAIRPFKQHGDTFLWVTPTLDVNTTSSGTTRTARQLTCPTGLALWALVQGSATDAHVFLSPDITDAAASETVAPLTTWRAQGATFAMGKAQVLTNTSAQIFTRSVSDNVLRIVTEGWIDRRGRDD